MRKYIVRYLIFWAPAAAVSLFFFGRSQASQTAQWFCAAFMVLGWAINTGMASRHYPRATLALLLGYLGANILLIVGLYNTPQLSPLHSFLSDYAGIFSYKPLDIIIVAIVDFSLRHEFVVTYALAGLCFCGWLIGQLYRRARPDPYRPTMGTRT